MTTEWAKVRRPVAERLMAEPAKVDRLRGKRSRPAPKKSVAWEGAEVPRFAKNSPKQNAPIQQGLEALLGQIKQEGALWRDVAKSTRLEYERNYEQLLKGWEMGLARKKTRYKMRAAGIYMMRKELKAIAREAKEILRSGIKGDLTQSQVNKAYGDKIAQGVKLLHKLRDFEKLPWDQIADPKAHYHQADHKQKPATDEQLEKFYAAAKRSSFKEAFLICEFSGVRPEELGNGVRVELTKIDGAVALRFHVESAKCDGKNKGLDLRTIEVKAPKDASNSVKERYKQLATIVATQGKKNGYIYRVEPTAKQTAGQRITNAFKTTAKAADVDMAAYSMRHRFSAQVKQANKGDAVAVALAMGHQSTETQRHYARANRSKGVSPVQITGINVIGTQIRGAISRAGPPSHVVEKVQIEKSISSRSFSPKMLKSKRL